MHGTVWRLWMESHNSRHVRSAVPSRFAARMPGPKCVARNVISCRRRKYGQSLDADDGLYESLGETVDPARQAISDESTAALRKQIERLPDDWRQALVLREYQGLAYKEIGELMGAS